MEASTLARQSAKRSPVPSSRGERGRAGHAEASWLWLAVLVFIAVSAWWFARDDRVPVWDAGSHLNTSWLYGVAFQQGHLMDWFTSYTTYPPLAHLVGAAAYLIGGMHPMAMEMAANIVFVPLLAFGCYGVGRELAGPRAGLLAGVFGLGTPMFVSTMHSFYVDTPQAAMVAIALWALLASRRFERIWVSLLAGVLYALALLVKETSFLFLVGPAAIMVLRGGWRRWGLFAFLAATLGLGLPWYVYHWSQLTGTYHGATTASLPTIAPPRSSLVSFGWYFWNLVNEQILLPFTIMFAIGVGYASVRIWRERLPTRAAGVRRYWRRWLPADEVAPELLVGALVAYLGITWIGLKDPRYSLPGLVYVAALATFWIVKLRWKWLRIGLSVLTFGLAAFYFAGMSFGIGTDARALVTLPGQARTAESVIYPGRLTLYEDTGWLRGPPQRDGDILGLLNGLHRDGVTAVTVDPQDDGVDFSFDGINPLVATAGMVMTPGPLNAPHTAYLFLHTPDGKGPNPCQRMIGDNGVYVVEGNVTGLDVSTLTNPQDHRQQYEFVCPGRLPQAWPR